MKRGKPALAICSTAFVAMGKVQAVKLGARDLPIVVVPHPFGLRTRDEVRDMAAACITDIIRIAGGASAS